MRNCYLKKSILTKWDLKYIINFTRIKNYIAFLNSMIRFINYCCQVKLILKIIQVYYPIGFCTYNREQ